MPPVSSLQSEALAACSVREPAARLALWLAKELKLPQATENGICRVTLPDGQSAGWEGDRCVEFCVDGSSSGGASPCGKLTPAHPFFQWICREVRRRATAVDAHPCRDPRSVYELSERLFARYRVDGGGVHLSGCTLVDQPFLRLTYAAGDDDGELVHHFFTPEGAPADAELREALGLAELCHGRSAQAQSDQSQIELLVAAGRRLVEAEAGASPAVSGVPLEEPLATTIVWVKAAHGKLQFTIGEESVEVAFGGWARTLEPPPFVCPHTGVASYHVAATDDGRIAAAEMIEACAETGRRVLASELVTCSVTNERVLPQLTRECPVTGDRALRDQFAECSRCRQSVSHAALRGGTCGGCRHQMPVRGDDPRVVWILSEYPRLGQWGRWRLAETAHLFIVTGKRLWSRVLVVFEKETLMPLYAATRGRFRRAWLPLDPTDQQDLFGERAMEKPV